MDATFVRRPMHVPYASHPAIADPALAGICARLVYAPRGRRLLGRSGHQHARSTGFTFRRCILPAGSTPIWKVRSRDIWRCASMPGASFARENQYLVAGPWIHIPWGDRAGEANFGEAANLDTDAILVAVV